MAKIKAIPTRFHGYSFRSRLEARWAVVFETLNINWQYEPEGLQSPCGDKWLPDFLLQSQKKKVWVEIKPPGQDADERLHRMAKEMSHGEYIWFISADIPDPLRLRILNFQNGGPENYASNLEGTFDMHFGQGDDDCPGWDCDHWLCICVGCGTIDIQFNGRSARIDCDCAKTNSDKDYTSSHPTLLKAYAAARGKRFEHEDREIW